MRYEDKMRYENEPAAHWLNSRTGWTLEFNPAMGMDGMFVVETADHRTFKSRRAAGPGPAIVLAAQAHGWKPGPGCDCGNWGGRESDHLPSCATRQYPIGTVTKANHRPCNCNVAMGTATEHSPWCHSREVEVAIGATHKPNANGDAYPRFVGTAAGRIYKGETTCIWDGEVTRQVLVGENIEAHHRIELRADGKVYPVDERTYEIKPNGPAITIDLTKAIACTCGTRDGKHANTCGALSSPKVERARPTAELFDNVARLDGTWKVFGEMVERNRRAFSRQILGVDPAIGRDSTVAVVHHGSLEWLARDLGLAPNAPDDVVKATVRKRLAGQFEELATAKSNNAIMGAELLASNERLERALCEIETEKRENDELRGMVAEVQLENRKLRGKR